MNQTAETLNCVLGPTMKQVPCGLCMWFHNCVCTAADGEFGECIDRLEYRKRHKEHYAKVRRAVISQANSFNRLTERLKEVKWKP